MLVSATTREPEPIVTTMQRNVCLESMMSRAEELKKIRGLGCCSIRGLGSIIVSIVTCILPSRWRRPCPKNRAVAGTTGGSCDFRQLHSPRGQI